MKTEVLWDLMLWAAMLSQHPMPEQLPAVEYVEHDFFVTHICQRECEYQGYYAAETTGEVKAKTIYLDKKLKLINRLEHTSIIVHEFVHYLQDKNGAITTTYSCEQWISNERQAYRAQAIYLKKHRMTITSRSIDYSRCINNG